MLGGGAGSIALVEPDGALRFRTVQGPAAPRLIERTLPHGTGLLGWSIAHRTPLVVDRAGQRSAPRARGGARGRVSPQHLMVAPLIEGDDVIGGIEIIDQRRSARDGDGPWNDEDLKLLVLIAAQTAGAISLARRRSEQSNRDRLGLDRPDARGPPARSEDADDDHLGLRAAHGGVRRRPRSARSTSSRSSASSI